MEQGYIIKHNEQQYEIHTAIIINAPATLVWATLTDFATMPNWSSAFKGLEGEFADGAEVLSLYHDAEMGLVKAPHKISVVDGIKFSWSDEFNVLPGMRDNHHYIVNDIGNEQTRFIQRDTHTGSSTLNTPDGQTIAFNAEMLTASQLAPFMQFNRELKAEAERRFAAQA